MSKNYDYWITGIRAISTKSKITQNNPLLDEGQHICPSPPKPGADDVGLTMTWSSEEKEPERRL